MHKGKLEDLEDAIIETRELAEDNFKMIVELQKKGKGGKDGGR